MRIEDFIEQSNQATNLTTLFSIYSAAMEQYGYDRVLFALVNDHPTLQQEAQHGVVKNYPEDWVAHYLAEGYDKIDPVRQRVMVSVEAFTWDQLVATTQFSKIQQKLFNEAREAGLNNGIGIPLRGPGGTIAGVGAASSQLNVSPFNRFGQRANLITYQFYFSFWRLMEQKNSKANVQLSQREKDILLWSATGKSREDIALALFISSHTVDYHIRNIFRKLETHTMISAVVKAIQMGYINP